MTSSSTKKFDYVVSFGCSLAWGDELRDRNQRYAQRVADKFGARLIDYSLQGASNEIISQNIVNLLLAKKEKFDPSRTLVLVEWSFSGRLNFCGKDNRYYVIAQYNMEAESRKFKLKHGHTHINFNGDFEDMMDLKFYYNYHTNPTFTLYNLARNIHHSQTFLKYSGYDYIFLFADDFERHLITSLEYGYNNLGLERVSSLDSYPDFQHSIKDIDDSLICPTSFVAFTLKNNYKIGKFQHPLEDAHFHYSKVLIDFIESKYGKEQ